MRAKRRKPDDLSVTALYTSQAWVWGRFDCAELLATKEAKTVFDVTNIALGAVRLVRRRLPLLRHSLVQRHALLDRLVAESGATQVIELGAGLSQRGASVSADPALLYTEIDLPPVIAFKRELLARGERGRAVLARDNLRFVEADLRAAPLDQFVEPSRPAFVIAEGLLMYLEPDEQRDLWARAAAAVRHAGSGTFAFDLVPSREQLRPGLSGRALERLMKRFTGGRAFTVDDRTRDDIAAELRDAGFDSVETLEPSDVERSRLPFPDARTQVLVFVCRASA